MPEELLAPEPDQFILPVANPGALSEKELTNVLRSSLYPGASNDSLALVISYCAAAKLDVMQKPVHIVPMWSKAANKMVDVIMPGIGLYRVQAARSGLWAGESEPEFGPTVRENLGGVEMEYPEWCRVTISRRLVSGELAIFTGVERWKENYATASKDTKAPNSMWAKRPFAQLAKCASAQALRRAFPEMCGPPTAEEMEGKVLHNERDVTPKRATGEVREIAHSSTVPDEPPGEPARPWQDFFPAAWDEQEIDGKRLADIDDEDLGPMWKKYGLHREYGPILNGWAADWILRSLKKLPNIPNWDALRERVANTPEEITMCTPEQLWLLGTEVRKERKKEEAATKKGDTGE